MIISFHSRADKTRFHTNGSAPGLIGKEAKGNSEMAYCSACYQRKIYMMVRGSSLG